MVKFFVIITLFISTGALACQCYPDYKTKTYQKIEDKWYGKKAFFTCKYECKDGGFKEEIVGSHEVTIVGKEKGNEIICAGTIYRERYNAHTQWFIYHYEGSQWFNPKKSKSKELNEWAERHCR
jgi:hypothetical protein